MSEYDGVELPHTKAREYARIYIMLESGTVGQLGYGREYYLLVQSRQIAQHHHHAVYAPIK